MSFTVFPFRILNFTKMCFVAHTMLSHQELCSGTMAMLWSSSIAKADEEIKNNDDETCAYLFMTDQYSFSDISWLVAATKIVFTSGSFLGKFTAPNHIYITPK